MITPRVGSALQDFNYINEYNNIVCWEYKWTGFVNKYSTTYLQIQLTWKSAGINLFCAQSGATAYAFGWKDT